MAILLTKTASANKKLGYGVHASYRMVGSGKDGGSCPDSCPLLKSRACYALMGRVSLQSKHAKRDDGDGEAFKAWVGNIPRRHVVRHHVSGDLAGADGKPDMVYAAALKQGHEESGIKGWGYTHMWRDLKPEDVNSELLTFNASCDTAADVVEAIEAGWPAVMTLPVSADIDNLEPIVLSDGTKVRVRVCLEQTQDIPCSECKLCWKGNRKQVVGFMAHGSRKRYV